MNSKKIYIQPKTTVEHVTFGRLMQVGGSGGENWNVEEEETKIRLESDIDTDTKENNDNFSWGSLW